MLLQGERFANYLGKNLVRDGRPPVVCILEASFPFQHGHLQRVSIKIQLYSTIVNCFYMLPLQSLNAVCLPLISKVNKGTRLIERLSVVEDATNEAAR